MSLWEHIGEHIAAATGAPLRNIRQRPVGGGCINSAHLLEADGGRWFVKLNRAERRGMFEAEAAGLAELAQAKALRVPVPLCWGSDGEAAFLVLEQIEIRRGDDAAAARLGRGLAALHRHTGPCFGGHRDNFIGATPQPNAPADDWATFFRERRLLHQAHLAAARGHRDIERTAERLAARVERLFDGYGTRRILYNLYHVLNHLNLFGGGYEAQARRMMEKLLAQTG